MVKMGLQTALYVISLVIIYMIIIITILEFLFYNLSYHNFCCFTPFHSSGDVFSWLSIGSNHFILNIYHALIFSHFFFFFLVFVITQTLLFSLALMMANAYRSKVILELEGPKIFMRL